MLSAYPEIDGVWSQGGAMTQGAIDAFIAAGRDLVPMTSEGNNGALKAWYENRDNGLSCIAPSNPTYTSAEALRTVIKALDGEDVPKNVVMDIETVTEDNLEDYYRPDMPDQLLVLTELDDKKHFRNFTSNRNKRNKQGAAARNLQQPFKYILPESWEHMDMLRRRSIVAEEILRMTNITKRFAGITALDRVEFSCNKGEVHSCR